ncbi:hypothetical protein ACFP9V_25035 [Deinococcus radiopugnans]
MSKEWLIVRKNATHAIVDEMATTRSTMEQDEACLHQTYPDSAFTVSLYTSSRPVASGRELAGGGWDWDLSDSD